MIDLEEAKKLAQTVGYKPWRDCILNLISEVEELRLKLIASEIIRTEEKKILIQEIEKNTKLCKFTQAQGEFIKLVESELIGWDDRWPEQRAKIADLEKENG
jgi:hypothetical protein